jgi:hypothetical protein
MVYALDSRTTTAIQLLRESLALRIAAKAMNWLDHTIQHIANSGGDRVFFTAFSAAPRYVGKADLHPTAAELQVAEAVRAGWSPASWSVAQAARSLLVLALPQETVEKYLQPLERLFVTADVGELVALYQMLPLLPHPEQHRLRAAEGIRSNMTVVFNAVALQNPYPFEQLDTLAWNQMVLKALFVGSSLNQIHGLDRRANPELARMLLDYAHERRSAGRSVSSELWPLIKPFIDVDEF